MRKYKINSKSDMRRLQKDLAKDVKTIAINRLSAGIESTCPKCGKPMMVYSDKAVCQHCRSEFPVDLKIK